MCDSIIRGSDIEPLFVEFIYFEIPCRSITGNPFSEIILPQQYIQLMIKCVDSKSKCGQQIMRT